MKKYVFVLLTLIITTFLTGCSTKITDEYRGIEDINVEHDFNNKTARITIKDEYTKDNVKYFVFTTDISDDKKFTLSEADYDKYIGNGNDAVDCTIYSLNLNTTLLNYDGLIIPNSALPGSSNDYQTLWNTIDKIDNVDANYPAIPSFYISSAYGTEFLCGEYAIEVPYKTKTINEEISLCRYSFAGETDFTEEEIDEYKQIMDKVSLDYLSVVNDSYNYVAIFIIVVIVVLVYIILSKILFAFITKMSDLFWYGR